MIINKEKQTDKILVVAAHPDDEVLGCGGTIARHAYEGDEVHVVFMADGVTSRENQLNTANIQERNHAAIEACLILGAQPPRFLGFPDNQMDSLVLLDVIRPLEALIQEIKPSVVYTHYHGDLNIDHRITYQAVMTACRPVPNFCVSEIYSFEVLSSSEWAANGNSCFRPTMASDISEFLDKKAKALRCYQDEMRGFPHARSYEAATYQVKIRGAQFGLNDAEVFSVERLIRNSHV